MSRDLEINIKTISVFIDCIQNTIDKDFFSLKLGIVSFVRIEIIECNKTYCCVIAVLTKYLCQKSNFK